MAASAARTTGVPPIVHEVLGAPGRPLDPAARAFMEPRLGHDFSRVRVHDDARAARSAGAVDALAYTVGEHIVFGERAIRAGIHQDRALLAHELTHVLQQCGGSVGGTLTIDSPDSAAERDAVAVASRVADRSAGGPSVSPRAMPQASPAALHRAPTFAANCHEYERCLVAEPLGAARQMVDRALGELAPVAAGTVTAGRIVDLVNVHFHDPSNVSGRAAIVLQNFRAIRAELDANIRFDCHGSEADCNSERGRGGAFTGDQPGGDITLCQGYLERDCTEQGRMLIHEICHHIPATQIDRAYVHEAGYMALPPEQATQNPDSYAQFARMVFLGTPSCKECSSEVQLRPGQY